jgi:surface protein
MSTTLNLQGNVSTVIHASGAKLYGKPMTLSVNITNGDNDNINLPLNYYKNIIVDWGDGTIISSPPGTWSNDSINHIYLSTELFNIRIYVYDLFTGSSRRTSKGQIPHYGLNDASYAGVDKITGVDMGTLRSTSYKRAFGNASNLTSVTGKLEKSAYNLELMFYDCTLFVSSHALSRWNTSNVTDMSGMFNGCSLFKPDLGLSRWNTSNVTTICFMAVQFLILTFRAGMFQKLQP